MSYLNLSDRALIRRYRSGDHASVEFLIKRYQDRVFSTLYYMVKNRELAEDLFQETFIKVVRTLKSDRYNEEGKFSQWVMRIAYNLCIDYFRKQKRAIKTAEADTSEMVNYLKSHHENADDRIMKKQVCDEVRELIETLPPEQKEVVILRHYADLSFKEIAELTNVSINTALGRMRYALNNLRKVICEKQMEHLY